MNIEEKLQLRKFVPRDYQLKIAKAIEVDKFKRVILCWPRRAGKDIFMWNLMIRAALRKVGVYFYIFPTYAQAKKVIWQSLSNDGIRFLDWIPSTLIESSNSQDMSIRLTNGSLIQLIGSDNIDSIVGTNPIGVCYSEAALQDPRAYQFIRPILAANDGFAWFVSCVNPETIVLTELGLSRIKNISKSREQYSDLNKQIYGLGGFHNAEQFYYGGIQKTLKIELESGYEIECTPIHPLWSGKEWVKSGDLSVGDLIPIQYGQNVWGNGLDISDFVPLSHDGLKWGRHDINLNDDFFYLLGLIHADGSYDKSKVTVTKKKDPEIIKFLHKFGFTTFKDGIHHTLNSRQLCLLLEYLGFKHGARNKELPEKLFECTKEQIRSFFQGLFDGDGTSNRHPAKHGCVKLTSTCLPFIKDLQIVLLNFGIASGITYELKMPTERVKVSSQIYNLEISGYFAYIFYRDIGFRLLRKQINLQHLPDKIKKESGNYYPFDFSRMKGYGIDRNPWQKFVTRRTITSLNSAKPHPYLEELLSEKFFYSPIKSIKESTSEVFDFVIPETHSFFSNGFISHNTPRGKNWFYELFQIALHSSDWFASKLTLDDTEHIPMREIDRERAEGILSEDLIQQEYFTSWDMGVEGAYYSRYLDRMRVQSRIGDCPWVTEHKVHTAWDLGMRDSTTIIFFQTIGQTLRIIDCYENSGLGLDHYVKVLQQKPYVYGKHIGPHDIKVRELGTGMSRLEKARQMGLSFTVAPDLSIEDGIEAVRAAMSRMWIDEVKCAPLIKALENYRHEYDEKKKAYKANALHNWASHFSDSCRYLCISLPKTRDGASAEDIERNYREAMGGSQSHLPAVFRDDLPNF